MHFWGPVVREPEPKGYKDALDAAYTDFLQWKSVHKVPSSQKRFTYWMIFRDEYGSYFNTKGYNARVVCLWLQDVLARAQSNPPLGLLPDPRLYACFVAVSLASSYFSSQRLGFKILNG